MLSSFGNSGCLCSNLSFIFHEYLSISTHIYMCVYVCIYMFIPRLTHMYCVHVGHLIARWPLKKKKLFTSIIVLPRPLCMPYIPYIPHIPCIFIVHSRAFRFDRALKLPPFFLVLPKAARRGGANENEMRCTNSSFNPATPQAPVCSTSLL